MKKLSILICTVAVGATAPGLAEADPPPQNPAEQCKAAMPEKEKGNAYGKCVSEKAKEKPAAPAEPKKKKKKAKVKRADRVDAAKLCKAAKE